MSAAREKGGFNRYTLCNNRVSVKIDCNVGWKKSICVEPTKRLLLCKCPCMYCMVGERYGKRNNVMAIMLSVTLVYIICQAGCLSVMGQYLSTCVPLGTVKTFLIDC